MYHPFMSEGALFNILLTAQKLRAPCHSIIVFVQLPKTSGKNIHYILITFGLSVQAFDTLPADNVVTLCTFCNKYTSPVNIENDR